MKSIETEASKFNSRQGYELKIFVGYLIMITNRFNSWVEYFDSKDSSSAINKKKLSELFQAFDHSFSSSEMAGKLEKSNQTVFLAKLSINGGLQLFHNFLQAGDPLYSDDSTHSGLIVGMQRATSTGMTPDISILLKDPADDAIPVPKREEIMNCDDLDAIEKFVTKYDAKYSSSKLYPASSFPREPDRKRDINFRWKSTDFFKRSNRKN